jgi:type II secretory pathway predicted ATPase ExeA/cell division septation protein DedD
MQLARLYAAFLCVARNDAGTATHSRNVFDELRRTMTDRQHNPTTWRLPASDQTMAPDFSDRIYSDFFNLNSSPFSITPDPYFLFLSETHRDVLEKIQYGIQGLMGFMLLTGEVGTGKTTLCRALLDHLQDRVRTVYVINPSLSGQELLAGILDDLGVDYPGQASKKDLIDHLNAYLLDNEDRKPVVIIVDDAQTMPLETLEDLRLLSNLETDKTKLLQMLLVGQPELMDNLDQPRMRQLRQRVAVNCHLDYLSVEEVGGYIERRLFIAGNQGQIRFSAKVIRQVHQHSDGVPRMINKICDMALIAAYADNSFIIQPHHLKAAAGELIELQRPHGLAGFIGRHNLQRSLKMFGTAAALFAAMAVGFCANAFWGRGPSPITAKDLPAVHTAESSEKSTLQTAGARLTSQNPDGLLSMQSRAYILQLGSFNTLATTLRAADIYSRKGIAAHWNEVQLGAKGLWYRVFAGRFESIEAARRYQDAHGLKDAQILFAPWSVLIDRAGEAERISSVRKRIQARGVDAYAASGDGHQFHLFAGAFITQERAQALARRIHEHTGVETRVAHFHPALISKNPAVVPDAGGDPS